MNFQRILALTSKDLKRLIREPATLFMLIMFPVVFTLIFGFSFGAIGGSQTATYQVGLVRMDADEAQEKWTQYFVGNLSNVELLIIQTYADNGTNLTSFRERYKQ